MRDKAPTAGNGNERSEFSSGKRQSLFDITVFCAGTNPLLGNEYQEDQMVNDLVFKVKRVPDTETPLSERARKTIVRDPDGKPAIKTEAILSCLCEAGCYVPLKGRVNLSRAGGAQSMVPNFLKILDGEYVPLLRPDGRPVGDALTKDGGDWKVDVRRGILGDGKTTCAIVRAKFLEWAFVVKVRVDTSKVQGLSLKTVRKLFEVAGDSKGLGGFRKVFGRFTIAEGGWLVTAVDESKIVRLTAPAHLMQAREGAVVVETA